ncbi:DUF4271 domain-containing protein [Parapedobacter koreensis]|uniref:DUF4271 domain-containing protein n=1 Tax=Parapedobacter koreensis TaxID=332977 RepID=A0A1H7SQ80_9SPHI|nr:DUF4271 domain-containing protein [Parapedobacter koreensis]SEL74751.1 protein of unknown function [Parapedobacter koreensis]
MAIKWWFVLVIGLWCAHSTAVFASASAFLPQNPSAVSVRDSIRQAQLAEKKRMADSVARIQDALRMQYIGLPDPGRPNQFVDSLRKLVVVEKGDFIRWIAFARSLEKHTEMDNEKATREPWMIIAAGLLLLFLGIIRAAFPNEVVSIIHAFYSDRVLLQINKEDTLYSSWPFVFLYILFGFALGLFLYVCNLYYVTHSRNNGIESFLGISIFVMLLFILKIIATRFLGFVFDVQRLVREYISILYLSYFNAALVFLPTILALTLVPQNQMVWIIPLSLTIVLCLFLFRLTKTVANLLTNHRFSKFYLFMYLCCLEIAPVLILVKVLNN